MISCLKFVIFLLFDLQVMWLFRELSAPYLFLAAQWNPRIRWRTKEFRLKWGGMAESIESKVRLWPKNSLWTPPPKPFDTAITEIPINANYWMKGKGGGARICISLTTRRSGEIWRRRKEKHAKFLEYAILYVKRKEIFKFNVTDIIFLAAGTLLHHWAQTETLETYDKLCTRRNYVLWVRRPRQTKIYISLF